MILLLYQLLFPLIGLGILAALLLQGRGRSLREGFADIGERLGGAPPGAAGAVWFHAASVGEVTAAQPLIARAVAAGARVIVTTSTTAGRARAREISGLARAQLAPLDFYPAVARFLARTRPAALILIETELWPMTLTLAARRGLRLAAANGRITERAFGRYRLIGGLMRRLLRPFELVCAQTEEAAARFRALGAPEVRVCGNMKYDLAPARPAPEAAERLAAYGFDPARTWTAGSTRRGEEEVVLAAQRLAKEKLPGLRLILAPRHPERAEEAAALLEQAGTPYIRWSQKPSQSAEVLLVDAIGVLPALYAVCGAAFVGGTLVPVGGHNLLEPAQLGKPVAFGPYVANTPDPARALKRGGGREVGDAAELAAALRDWLGEPAAGQKAGAAARDAAEGFRGAAARTAEALAGLLTPLKTP